MQESFAFISGDLVRWRALLCARFGRFLDLPRRKPIGQLVKSIISSRTRDAVSREAYRRLGRRWPRTADLAAVPPVIIAREIAAVTFAEDKARYLSAALRRIARERGDFDLGFLAEWPLGEALDWLERLPGVGRKVAASTVCHSTLRRPVFVVDSHIARVLRRLGFVAERAEPRAASEAVTAAAPNWNADDLLELHTQMKLLGQTICRLDAPHCALCPLAGECPTAACR